MKTCIFSIGFRKILRRCIYYYKSFVWEPNCSVRTDRQIEKRDETNSRFPQIYKRTKNWKSMVTIITSELIKYKIEYWSS